MKLYQIIWLSTFLLLAINVPDYFTCSKDCHFFRDYTKYYPKIEEEEDSPRDNHNTSPVPPRNPPPPDKDPSDSDNDSSDSDNEDDPLFDKNEAMLVWSMIFKNQTMLMNLANTVWDRNIPVVTFDQANKIRVEFNKELQKIATSKWSEIEPEDPEGFPLETSRYAPREKEEFLRDIERLTEYGDLLEILGERLWPAVIKVFNEKYADKEKTMGSDAVYYEFFEDVAQELGVDFNDYFNEVDEATEGVYWKDDKWIFSFEDVVLVARDNFYRIAPFWLETAELFSFFYFD